MRLRSLGDSCKSAGSIWNASNASACCKTEKKFQSPIVLYFQSQIQPTASLPYLNFSENYQQVVKGDFIISPDTGHHSKKKSLSSAIIVKVQFQFAGFLLSPL